MTSFLYSPLFGLTITFGAWWLGLFVQKHVKHVLCNPLIVSAAVLIAFLRLAHIPYAAYAVGGDVLRIMLAPVTAVLARNVYEQRALLGKYFMPVVLGCLAGAAASVGTIYFMCRLLALDAVITSSLLPKSVTTAIALAICESRGGIAGITIAGVMVSGLVGAVFAPQLAKLFRIDNPIAEGAAIGACSHALGTTAALEIGALQGAMSSVSLCLCGIFTSIIVVFI